MLADATVLGGKASSTAASILPALGSEKRLLAGEAGAPSAPGTATTSVASVSLVGADPSAGVESGLGRPRLAAQDAVTVSGKTRSFLHEASTF